MSTNRDRNGNQIKSISFCQARPCPEEVFDRFSITNENKINSISIDRTWSNSEEFFDHFSIPKISRPKLGHSENVFYMKGFSGTRSRLATVNNIVSGTGKDGNKIDTDFVLTADYNECIGQQCSIAFHFDKDAFSFSSDGSKIDLMLSLDSQCIRLNPARVNDSFKTKTWTTTVDGVTEEQKQCRFFTVVEFFVDEETLHKIADSKDVVFQLRFSDSETVFACLTENNYAILAEFSALLNEINREMTRNL